jgi:Predicted membrane protein (DUF2243)
MSDEGSQRHGRVGRPDPKTLAYRGKPRCRQSCCHEILQWHHMISGAESSNTLAGLELNVVADGFLHVVTWSLITAGRVPS